MFGRGVVDRTRVAVADHDVTITVDTRFGASRVEIDPAIAYDVDGSSTSGEVRMPDRNATAMGSLHDEHATIAPPRLHLHVTAVFGQCQVIEAPPAAA